MRNREKNLLRIGMLLLGASLGLGLSACAVGPGTPLIDALRTGPGKGSSNVPAPKGYGAPIDAEESSGLINPRERKETEEYLRSLASE